MDIPSDTSTLPPTSAKRKFPWRDTKVGLIAVRADGTIQSANTIAEKRALLERSGEVDAVLTVRVISQRPPGPEVHVVDDRAAALQVLSE